MLENPFSFFKLLKSLKKQLSKLLLMKLIVLMNHNFSHTSAINDFFKIVHMIRKKQISYHIRIIIASRVERAVLGLRTWKEVKYLSLNSDPIVKVREMKRNRISYFGNRTKFITKSITTRVH